MAVAVTTPVIGRQAELEAIDTFLARLAHGFKCLVLEGEAGVGKTTLWQMGVQRASDHSALVLTCQPSRAERDLPFAALGDLLERVDDGVLARLPNPMRRALEVALLRAENDDASVDQRAIAVAVLSLMRELATATRVMVAIDDAQWLDAPTADALAFVARRLDDEAVGMLLTARLRDGPGTTFERAVADARRNVVRLGPLPVAELHELLSLRLKHVFPRPTLVKIAQASLGNAFYAQEIARELLHAGRPAAGAPLPAPADLRELVATRVRRLPAGTREAMLAAAALSHPTTTLLDPDECLLRPAVDAEILRVESDGRIVFGHPLYASAVYELATIGRRRELHRRLATLVDEPEDYLRHLALATIPPDEDVAQALEHGAVRARCRGAWQLAGELLEQAAVFTPPDRSADALRRRIGAAEHYVHAGDRGRASSLLEEILADEHAAPARAQALCLLGQIRYNDESFAESLRLLEEARQYASDPRLVANIELDLAYAASQVWDFERSGGHVRRALQLLASVDDVGLHAMALAYQVMSEYLCGLGIDWDTLERAVAVEDPERVVALQRTPSGIQGLLLLLDGRLAEAREHLMAVRKRAIDRGDESDLAFFLSWLAWLETQAGDLQAAHDRAEEALLVATLTGGKTMRAFALACRAIVRAARGNIDQARRDCDEAECLAEQTSYAIAIRIIVVARCLTELSVDNVAGAWRAAESLVAQLADVRGAWDPSALLFLPDALEALIALGELDGAGVVLDAFQDRAQVLDRAWALATAERCRGLLLAARGDLAGAAEHLQAALVEHDRLQMPFELARTLLCLGRVQRRRKLRKSAREALTEARVMFERVGTPLWAAQARAELARTHLREAPAELTPSEQRVAELAGIGLTNKQIAERLFISPKTVEANLSRVYTKLSIGSRAELGARMARWSRSAP